MFSDLTPDQRRLLRELDNFGGVLIVHTRGQRSDYEYLEKAGLIMTFALNDNEIRYEGRAPR
jgi:hypothetical protein